MATEMSSPELLNGILVMLQRLETRFEDQNRRLSSIELSILSDAGSSTMSSTHPSLAVDNPNLEIIKPELQNPNKTLLEQHSPSVYAASIMKLRNGLDFDSRSELGLEPRETTVADGENDWCSVSVYSSRPLSRLELDIPPVPRLPQELEENSESEAHQSHDNGEVLATKYEVITPISVSTTPRESCSESQHSASTAPTSIMTPSWAGSKQAPRERVENAFRAYDNLKFSFKRSISLKRSFSVRSKNKRNIALEPTCHSLSELAEDMTNSVGDKETPTSASSLLQRAQKSANVVLSVLPNFVSWVGREMVNQQLKMLDVGV